jgi:imidazole glycerol-phosphate synthase subunit HisH
MGNDGGGIARLTGVSQVNVVIFDYRAGNLHSLAKAIALTDVSVSLETDPVRAAKAEVLVLPGVGAFGSAAARLAPGRLAIKEALESGTPCLGICLGMQLLFDGSEEGDGAGLSVIRGQVTKLRTHRVPQIGWNQLTDVNDPGAIAANLSTAYFANGYVCRPEDTSAVTAWTEHQNDVFPSIVRAHNVIGTQFHPEKSSAPGLRFIQEFIRGCAK